MIFFNYRLFRLNKLSTVAFFIPNSRQSTFNNQKYQERRRIDGHNITLRHPVEHASEDKEHGQEDRIARGFVAYLLCLLAFAFRQGKDYHQCPQHHQEFGAFLIKQQIGICNSARQHHHERKEQGQRNYEIPNGRQYTGSKAFIFLNQLQITRLQIAGGR